MLVLAVVLLALVGICRLRTSSFWQSASKGDPIVLRFVLSEHKHSQHKALSCVQQKEHCCQVLEIGSGLFYLFFLSSCLYCVYP